MARDLTQKINDQISAEDIKTSFIFKINGVDYSDYVISRTISNNKSFGANNGIFILDNNTGKFGEGGADKIEVGDIVELMEQFTGDVTQFKHFYGSVNQRSIGKQANNRTITLNCLDFIAILQSLDLDLEVEGISVGVVDEVLEPNYLPVPNDDLAQLFNYANDNIATKPIPLVRIRNTLHTDLIDDQYDGFEVYYSTGQLKLGCPLNVRNNFDLLSTYYYYTKGKYIEDIIEEILKKEDGYGNYLFGEASAQLVIDNHLTSDFNAQEGTNIDILYPNLTTKTITIEHQLVADVSAGDTSIILDSTEGLPESGLGEVNGDLFTWSAISSGTTLTGIPASGSNSLKAHNSGDYFEYEYECLAGQTWALSYDNLVTDLVNSDFDLPDGSTVEYVDKRYGRIILDSPIALGSSVKTNKNYTFKTLQATAIELNRVTFRPREIANRFEALNSLREYLAPNYIIRTQGDDKIWASYLSQKSTADYELELIRGINYLEDEDIYTRSLMWAKNKQPTNIMFGDDVDYSSEEEDNYTGIATKTQLYFLGSEKSGTLSNWSIGQTYDVGFETSEPTPIAVLVQRLNDQYIRKDYATQPESGYYIFSTVSNIGRIILGDVVPLVYINGVPIDNKAHKMTAVPITIKFRTKTITEGGGKSKSISVTTYYYYTVIFPHSSIDPSQDIYLYDKQGVLQYTLAAGNPNMDYSRGIWTVPGTTRNDVAEVLSTATYWVIYSTEKLIIEYDDAVFKIHSSILPEPETVTVRATFEYWAIGLTLKDINYVVDGRRDTQLQIEFYAEPPSGFHLATIDLGAIQDIQAIDIVGGFYRPDDHRKFDMNFNMSMEYSTDGINFYAISDITDNFEVQAGEAISFEEEDLGAKFQARYLKFILQKVDKVEYGRGVYVVAITEISVYDNIVIKSEAKLISTTILTGDVGAGDNVINVVSTANFMDPESGQTATAYLDKDSNKPFTYTGLTSTSFIGCTVESGISASSGEYVVQTIESDTTLYDEDNLLTHLGDRVYKKILISDRNLYLQAELDKINKAYLKEFKKNHTKIQIEVLYAPYLKIGQTIHLLESYNNIDTNYFIDSINDKNGYYTLTLARYP